MRSLLIVLFIRYLNHDAIKNGGEFLDQLSEYWLLKKDSMVLVYGVITNDVSDYINLLVRIAHIICNHPIFSIETGGLRFTNTQI
jgi:hypothetical protein